MTEADVNNALEEVFKDRALKKELEIDKYQVYNIRNDRVGLSAKLEILFKAGKLKLVDGPTG